MRSELPIDAIVPDIVDVVKSNPLVLLEAEPGAGKTTRVPPALLAAGLEHVYVLEPRRLAARMAARRVAQELGQTVGDVVGYQVRFEGVSSARTKLWYFTEGVLTRKLLSDRRIKQARVVVLDEFHERHLETDFALALVRKLQESRRDLRIVIMSATLSSVDLAARLGKPPVIRASGRMFPVSVRYTPHSAAPLEEQVASAVSNIAAASSGHILVFLPGAGEIRKALASCEPGARKTGARILPLHGDLSPEEQDAAVAPSGTRKIICSTNVAESSITIDGVEAVIDSGLARVLSHSPWSGISRLQIEKISKASAIQRAGRAGRTAPGVAIRLYPESDFVRRPEQTAPEILRADLAQLTLQIAAYGLHWDDLDWLDTPSREMREHARELLALLGAFDSHGSLSGAGHEMARLPVHPRLARLALKAAEMDARREGAELAARLAEGRFRFDDSQRGRFISDIDVLFTGDLSYQMRRLMQQLQDTIPRQTAQHDSHAIEKAILSAYPDRVARKRGETLLLSNGTSARLDRQSVIQSEFMVAVDVDDRSDQSKPLVRIASPIEPDWLLDLFPDSITTHEEMIWNRESERVEQVNALRYGQLVVDDSRTAPANRQAASDLVAAKAIEAGVERFTDAEEFGQWMRRVNFAAEHSNQVALPPDFLAAAVGRLADGLTSFNELREAAKDGGFLAVLESALPMRLVNELAPTHVSLPSGRRARIEYHEGRRPSVSSRLQDFFGLRESPCVARGAVPLVIQLLAPNHRPIQVTTDLVSFWKNLYPQVRRELSRRYPKHSWPENPL